LVPDLKASAVTDTGAIAPTGGRGAYRRPRPDALVIEEDDMDRLLLTPTEAAAALGIGRSKVYELMLTGQLESVHIGTCRRVPAEALHSFLLGLRARASA
jgi:excisionase family DNA binding protein